MTNKFFSIAVCCMCIVLFTSAEYECMGQRMMERRLSRHARENTGPVPDYSRLDYWAASPYKPDCSDSIPAFLKGEQRTSDADVFFIHPTTYTADLKKASWNADVDDSALNEQTDRRPILYQASVFNGSCRVFAPRYRQAHLKAFIAGNSKEAKQALDLAYSDVKRAFQYYLEHDNNGRPIIIASHSQGSHHAIRLLQEFFDGTPLQRQLVCAYVLGWPFKAKSFQSLPIGESADAVGCVVGWCTFQEGQEPRYLKVEDGKGVCINPLTWSASTERASRELHRGAVFRDFNTMFPNIISASIDPKDHVLWVTLPEAMNERVRNIRNLHGVDYNLFWMDIRENVKLRIASYLQQVKK